MKARLDRLEAENIALREQVETKMTLDMEALSVWLEEQIQVRLADMSPQTVEVDVIDAEVVELEVPAEVVELEEEVELPAEVAGGTP